MITKTSLILFSILAILFLVSVGIIEQEVRAVSIFIFQIPEFEDWLLVKDVSTYRSFVSGISYVLDDEGKARLYAKDTSNVQYPQASVEYTKRIVVETGDVLDIRQESFLKKASFYNQDSEGYSHVTAFPTIHKLGESDMVGYTDVMGCDSKPTFIEINSNVRNKQLTSTLYCDGLTAGIYEISAYVHARANENSDRKNASVFVEVSDIELSIKRIR